jgi:Protein of unknown function (DUF2530)
MAYSGAMARSKHGRERRRVTRRSKAHSHRVERSRRSDRRAEPTEEPPVEEPPVEQPPAVPPRPEPALFESHRAESHRAESHQVESHRAESHRTDHRRAESHRTDHRRAEPSRTERRRTERHHIVADVEPLDVDGVRTVAIGSVAWIVAFVSLLPFIGALRDHDRLSWLWICIAGFGLGLIGVEYCRRRRNLLAEEPDRRRTESSRFGAAGD